MKRILYAVIVLMLLCAVGTAFGQKISDEARKHFDRGMAAVEMAKTPADYEAAIAEFEKAGSLFPDWPELYYNLGLVQEKAGKYEDAINSLKRYVQLAPNASDVESVKSLINKLEYRHEKIEERKSRFGTFTDSRDGKVYKTVAIGNQVWMADNLAHKAKGGSWAYSNDESDVKLFGYFYAWETARTICPSGWHLPNDAEWQELSGFLGGSDDAGRKMKTTRGWKDNGDGTNESGFTGIASGYRARMGTLFAIDNKGVFKETGEVGYWWSSTDYNINNSNAAGKEHILVYRLSHKSNILERLGTYKGFGHAFSVRCIKD